MEEANSANAALALAFREELKLRTAPQHKNLESHVTSKSLLEESLSLDQYAFYLSLMKEVIQDYDQSILPAIENYLPDAPSRKRSDLIRQDLAFLQSRGIELKPVHAFRFRPGSSSGFLFGLGYVMEGSTLGGSIIKKHVEKTLHFTEAGGILFFNGYGTQTGMRWNVFLKAFTGHIIEKGLQQDAISGAVEGFNAIYHHFESNLYENPGHR